MSIRNILMLAGLAAFLAACVINPRPVAFRGYDQRYNDDYYDYRSTPSYEGYYYARIIFIRNVPYYVDDDRNIRPIPPRLHDHFRGFPYNTLGRPPIFSRGTEVRDGYRMSRIIYLDGVPYHVENDHIAQPLPERLHSRFRYTSYNQGNAPANGNLPQPYGQHDNGRNGEPPAHVRDQDRKRDEPGPNGRDRERIEQPAFERGQREGESKAAANSEGRATPSLDRRGLPLRQDQPNAGESHADTTNGKERYRIEQPAFERVQREGESKAAANPQGRATPFLDRRGLPLRQDQPNAGESHADTTNGKESYRIEQPAFERVQREGESKAAANSEGRATPFLDRRGLPLRQDQPNAAESHADATNGKEHDRNGNRPPALSDTRKENADKKKSGPDKKGKPDDSGNKKDKQGDSTQADDDSSNKKDNGKKSHRWKDDEQKGNDRGNSNKRD